MAKKKVLLIRLDKIGDLICTLPTDQILDEAAYDVTWIIQKGYANILDLGEKKRKYIELDKKNPEAAQKIFADYLTQNDFDIAVSFQCPWWINFELFKARIPKRIGSLSQWHSFLFLNSGLRQKRSAALKHEFEYNLDLVKKITGPLTSSIDEKKIFFRFRKPTTADVIQKFNLYPPNYVVVHPGMMGSALNWPEDHYIIKIQDLITKGQLVVITGTDADEPYLKKIKSIYLDHPQVRWLQSKLNFSELLQVLYYAEKIIAPSTGVAHIAASLGKEVHGIYSPVKVHHPVRWAPRGDQVFIHLPNVACPATHQCLLEKCPYYNCMNKIVID